MKKFAFSLDRVLSWRRLQRDTEQAALDKAVGERNALVARLEAFRGERAQCEQSLAHALSLGSQDVLTLPAWQGQIKTTLHAMTLAQHQLEQRVSQQQARFREAERQVKLLERIREQRLAAWKTQAALEEEAFAAEAYLARCIRLKRASPAGA